MPRSPGFGSNASNSVALFRLAFAAPTPIGLSLLDTLSHRPIMQEVRSHRSRRPKPSVPLPLLVGIRFQVYFTPLIGVLFTFPSRYLCTIGHQGVFRLGGWSPHVQTGLHVSRPTRGPTAFYPYGALTHYGHPFQDVPVDSSWPLACSAFARHYSRNLC